MPSQSRMQHAHHAGLRRGALGVYLNPCVKRGNSNACRGAQRALGLPSCMHRERWCMRGGIAWFGTRRRQRQGRLKCATRRGSREGLPDVAGGTCSGMGNLKGYSARHPATLKLHGCLTWHEAQAAARATGSATRRGTRPRSSGACARASPTGCAASPGSCCPAGASCCCRTRVGARAAHVLHGTSCANRALVCVSRCSSRPCQANPGSCCPAGASCCCRTRVGARAAHVLHGSACANRTLVRVSRCSSRPCQANPGSCCPAGASCCCRTRVRGHALPALPITFLGGTCSCNQDAGLCTMLIPLSCPSRTAAHVTLQIAHALWYTWPHRQVTTLILFFGSPMGR